MRRVDDFFQALTLDSPSTGTFAQGGGGVGGGNTYGVIRLEVNLKASDSGFHLGIQ